MADGLKKNALVVWEQIRESWALFVPDITDTWNRIGVAVDDRDWLEVGHLLTAAAGDVLKFLLRLDRLWLYVLLLAALAWLL